MLVGEAHSFVVNRVGAGLIATAAVLLLLVVAHLLIIRTVGADGSENAVERRRRGVKALVIGADGRASTSKLQVVLWFFGVFFAFTFLFAWGRSTDCGDPDLADGPRCVAAEKGREAFRDVVHGELQPEYYVLLGFPLVAAVAAKALTVNKVASGTLTKPPLGATDADVEEDGESAGGVTQGLAEVMSNDRGDADLLDFQYFAFNLLALAYFAIEFLTHPEVGLPDLPPTLIALSGVSAATYTTKKALETDVRAVVTRVIPDPFPAVAGTTIRVVGTGFGPPPGPAAPGAPLAATHLVLLDGRPLTVAASAWSDRVIEATLDDAAVAAIGGAASATLVVVDSSGRETQPLPVAVSP
jgi:hypothetical protein